jgi:release factor glutamine methyltransferase
VNEERTIAHALHWATEYLQASSATPRLDAEVLLAHVLGWGRARLLSERQALLDTEQYARFEQLVERRAWLEPVAYLVGHREFYGRDFVVTPAVLVPRPETELLVERALAWARGRQGRPLTIADIGTGSGIIAVTLAAELPDAHVYATDLSTNALEVAARNAERHGVAAQVALLRGDLLEPLPEPVDLLVSNPPYTVLAEIDENVRRHEPHMALDGGPDGLAMYRRLLAAAPAHLASGGALMLEIGATQGAAVAALARQHFPGATVTVRQDLAGWDRVVEIVTS